MTPNTKYLIPKAKVTLSWGKVFIGPITKVTKRRVYVRQTFAGMRINVGLPRDAVEEIKRV
jgi:hypothetical protein